MKLSIWNQTIHLLPERAAFWSEEGLLIVSDIHLGKAIAMQKAGIAVPEGAMEEDLFNLEQVIRQTNAERCVIVGDLIHAKSGLSDRVKQKFCRWLQNLPCEIELVFGNHDRSLIKNLPNEWTLHPHFERLAIPPFCFCHIPAQVENYFVWSGHVHPKIVLSDGNDRMRLPCFQIFPNMGILPAFSVFTGGSLVKKSPNYRIFVTTGREVIEV